MANTKKFHEYEGEKLTLSEIQARVPAFKPDWVRRAVSEGCKSLADFHARDRRLTAAKSSSHKSNKLMREINRAG